MATSGRYGAESVPSIKNTTQACASKRSRRGGPINFNIPDIQDVILRGIGFKKHRQPICCEIVNADAIPKVAVVMLSSMTKTLYDCLGDHFVKCRRFLDGNEYPLQTNGGVDTVARDVAPPILEVKMDDAERSFVEGAVSAATLGQHPEANPMSYSLTLDDLCWHHYPLRSEWFSEGLRAGSPQYELLHDEFFSIPPGTAAAAAKKSPLFAIDCEMCETEEGYVPTSISVVNDKLECIYLSLIKPRDPIVDYRFEYSGITEEMLADVTTRLEDVQQKLAEIIPHDAILVGHSLESDLMALKMTHRYIFDTAVLLPNGFHKRKLRNLAKRILKLDIQQEASGHDATEDAVAAMRLAHFITTRRQGGPQERVSLFALAEACKKKGTVVDLAVACSKHCRGNTTGYPATNDEEVVAKSIRALPNTDLLWTRLSGIWSAMAGADPPDLDALSENEGLKAAISALDAHLYTLYEALPRHSLMVVVFDHEDLRDLYKFKAENIADTFGFRRRVLQCRTSKFFVCLKE